MRVANGTAWEPSIPVYGYTAEDVPEPGCDTTFTISVEQTQSTGPNVPTKLVFTLEAKTKERDDYKVVEEHGDEHGPLHCFFTPIEGNHPHRHTDVNVPRYDLLNDHWAAVQEAVRTNHPWRVTLNPPTDN